MCWDGIRLEKMRRQSRARSALIVSGTTIVVAIARPGGSSNAAHGGSWCVKGRRSWGIVASTLGQSSRSGSTESSARRGSTVGPRARCQRRSTRSRSTVGPRSGSRVVSTWCWGIVEITLVSAVGQTTPGRGTVTSTGIAPCWGSRSGSEGIVARARIMRGARSGVPSWRTVAQATIGRTISFRIGVGGTRSVILPSRGTRSAQTSPSRS
jgi:hypothetical protein